TGREVTADDVYGIFRSEYLDRDAPWRLIRHEIAGDPSAQEGQRFRIKAELECDGARRIVTGQGDGAISAFINAMGLPLRIMAYHDHAIGAGTVTRAACYVELRLGESQTGFGVGIHADIVTASFQAVLSAANRHIAQGHVDMVAEPAQTA